jgi:hypothetical protein
MFLAHRKTKGAKTSKEIIMEIKAVFMLDSKIENEMIKVPIPMATFSP